MWVISPWLEEGLELIKAWGYTYKTIAFSWVKQNKKSDSLFWAWDIIRGPMLNFAC